MAVFVRVSLTLARWPYIWTWPRYYEYVPARTRTVILRSELSKLEHKQDTHRHR